MLELKRITTADKELYAYMEQLIVASFPPEEYRALDELRHYTDEKDTFYNNIILHKGIAVGLLTYWDFDTFYYVEHFAIDPAQRNGGYGKEALNLLCQTLKHPIILEVEMPENELAKRRIGFYQRQGFILWDIPYRQPPYKTGDDFLPMYLMAYGALNPTNDYEMVKGNIYKKVYNA